MLAAEDLKLLWTVAPYALEVLDVRALETEEGSHTSAAEYCMQLADSLRGLLQRGPALTTPPGEGGTGAAGGRRKVVATWLDPELGRIVMRDDGMCFRWRHGEWRTSLEGAFPNEPIPQD